MTLFRIAGESLKFNIVDVGTKDLAELTTLIMLYGGEVTDDEECTIKFTTQDNNQHAYPRAQIFDVAYIRQCVKESKLVNLETYRLGPRKPTDRCFIAHFLHGYCKCWKRHRRLLPENSNVATLNGDEPVSVSRSISGQTEYHTAETTSTLDNSDSTDSDIEAIPEILEENPVSPSNIHRCVDESQPVLTHKEMDMYASSLAGGDAVESENVIDEKRPCNLEFQTEVKPKLAILAEQQRELTEKRASLREAVNRRQRSPRTIARNPVKQEVTNVATCIISDSDESCRTASPTSIDVKKEPIEFIPSSPSNDSNKSKKNTNFLRVIPEAREQFGEQTRARTPTIRSEPPSTSKENEANHQNGKEFSNEDKTSRNDEKSNEISLVPNIVHLPKKQTTLDEQRLKSKIQTKEKTIKQTAWISVDDLNIPRKGKRISATQGVITKDNGNIPKKRRQIVHDASNNDNETEKRRKPVISQETSNDGTKKSKRTGVLNKMSTQKNDIRYETVDSSEGIVSDSSDTDDITEDACRSRRKNLRSKGPKSIDEPGPSGIKKVIKIVEETSDSDSDCEEYRCPPKLTKIQYNQQWRLGLKQNKDPSYRPLRLPFTPEERKIIIQYLVKHEAVALSKGLVIWKRMISDGYLTHRTPQSILNHYKKYLLPNIESLGLDETTLSLFRSLKTWGK